MLASKQVTFIFSLAALLNLCLSSSSTVAANQMVRNTSTGLDAIFYSGSEEERSGINVAAHLALQDINSKPSIAARSLSVEHGLSVKKRHRKCKGKKKHRKNHHKTTKKTTTKKKKQEHKHKHKQEQQEVKESCNDSSDDEEDNTKSEDLVEKTSHSSKKTSSSSTKTSSTSKTNINSDVVKESSSLSTSSSSDGTVSSSSGSGSYQRVQENRGNTFWSNNNWQFWDYSDPTHGQVKFESESSAKSLGLIGMKNGAAYMRASNKDISGQDRPSVRFQSKKAFDTGLVIFDVVKMPVGCATWPALWTTKGSDWPYNGEIDVVEGTGYTSSGNNANQMTVHLGQNSPLNLKRRGVEKRASYVGKLMKGASNCNQWGSGSNTGCAFFDSNSNGPSWGTAFNSAGGGVWAMQFGNDEGVKIWFWGRKSSKLPSELSKADVSPEKLDPTSWGTPMANFQSSVINKMIKGQNIIMDITIGGDWAGNVPMDGTCKGKSLQEAIKKGSNYNDAEFIINGIDIYCKNGSC